MVLKHGGQLKEVAQSLGLDTRDWLDLSTGISPFSYPVPALSESIWRELPQQSDSLYQSAREYYGATDCLITCGSQSAIQALPRLWLSQQKNITKVLVPLVGYKEHEKAWRESGFNVETYSTLPNESEIDERIILVVINPNNPTGGIVERSELKILLEKIRAKNGWLIIDEAFMDILSPVNSMAEFANQKGLFVLRSFGKFFGLAGIRAGFVMAQKQMLGAISEMLGPWHVSGPTLKICEVALADKPWQVRQKRLLAIQAKKLKTLLEAFFSSSAIRGTDLFVTVYHPLAEKIHFALCRHKTYVRLCDEMDSLRFGIPSEEEIVKLEMVLNVPEVAMLVRT